VLKTHLLLAKHIIVMLSGLEMHPTYTTDAWILSSNPASPAISAPKLGLYFETVHHSDRDEINFTVKRMYGDTSKADIRINRFEKIRVETFSTVSGRRSRPSVW
jgi:hypothetical protein